jgi:anti-sigma B factor antagonist
MRDGRFPFTLVSGVPVVTTPEEIDITNAAALRSALLDAAAHGHGTLAVDMTATRFCDSSGLHALLAAHKRAEGEGGELLLVCSAAAVLRVFELTALDRMIPTFASLDQALPHAPRQRAGRPAERMRAASNNGSRPAFAPADLTEQPSA